MSSCRPGALGREVSSFLLRLLHGRLLCPGLLAGGGLGGGSLDTPRGSGSPQPAVFINKAITSTLCLGSIGSSGRFYVAPKARGLPHCGTVAHARTKFPVSYDSFYTPAGALLGKASARRTPSIARSDMPRARLPIFETGLMSTPHWESVFTEAIMKRPSTPARTPSARQTSPMDEILGGDLGNEDMLTGMNPSSISLLELDTVGDDEACCPMWTTDVEEALSPANWRPVAREQ